jgi:hypothetical protein
MILSAFTLFHVVLSLIGIASGFVVAYGLLSSKRLDGWTALFLSTTVATSVTGFLFPVHQFMPSHVLGILSLIVLAVAILARYRFGLAGGWRRTYAVTAVIALYFNVFVLQSEPPFQMAQLAALVVFALLAVLGAIKFRNVTARTA